MLWRGKPFWCRQRDQFSSLLHVTRRGWRYKNMLIWVFLVCLETVKLIWIRCLLFPRDQSGSELKLTERRLALRRTLLLVWGYWCAALQHFWWVRQPTPQSNCRLEILRLIGRRFGRSSKIIISNKWDLHCFSPVHFCHYTGILHFHTLLLILWVCPTAKDWPLQGSDGFRSLWLNLNWP